ncbi:glycosyltransferase family 4 protein [Oceanihabitans sediminis]|uniref:Glycosyl transferase family 1 n=1 Tax=Oceanihabitans sediminis TaxID=1812012 RepID=A0A368P5I5_9FLAO|nr:glycosyltransferase family 4 protein [Oceanihabitans sediminis]MDX1278757.1 glycosyltransferase family 4 protein [Oceanihabitans sediminis]MDX1773704.1 glycosyltransferase family 4 protein [Oceanihabitans sediminis]RBP33149.1 glycosyl transferase family 4 [Oceanihabitans sediminis]RCU57344.1 glycosyl transferase family 1 [Oceanihabitans sediminis]
MSKKKVLIISYYWPPAGGPGVQRWLKFVKYLPEFDVEPIVYIPENPNYPLKDESLTYEVSNDLTILKQPISEPYKLAGFLSKKGTKSISKGLIPEAKKQSFVEQVLLAIRGNFFIPDARKNWVKPSVNYLSNYIKKHQIDTIITTGPPHSLHLIGMQLKEKLGVRWIADFRDPWTTIGYHKELKLTKASKEKHLVLENKVLNTADQIVVTSSVTKEEFQEKTNKPIAVITNGYDTQKTEAIVMDKKFTLAHIGSLLSKRNPEVLWKVLKELTEENKEFSKEFQLKLVGAVSENVVKSIEAEGLSDYLHLNSYVSHNEAIKIQKESQILLLIEIDSEETKCIIPGKLFEYMVSNRPIIAIGPKGSDVEKIITETNTGNYFYYSDYDRLKSVLLNQFNAFQENTLQSHPIGLQKYSRRALTSKLAELIHLE